MFSLRRYIVLLGSLLLMVVGSSCSNSSKTAQAPSSSSSDKDSTQIAWDRPGMMVNGYQIPVFFEEEFADALKAARFEMGERSHGIWFWDRDGKFYKLDGKEHHWE